MFAQPSASACAHLKQMQLWRLPMAENNSAFRASVAEHLITKSTKLVLGIENWSFSRIQYAMASSAIPAYDSFWMGNKTFCREVIGVLYGEDVRLFVRTCTQPALRECTAYAYACDRELLRLRQVCGLDANFFSEDY